MQTTTTNPTTDELDQRLALVQQQAASLAPLSGAFDRIADALDELAADGNDQLAQTIGHNAVALIDGVEAAQAQLAAALEIAHKLREHREATRQALAELRRAVEWADTDNPQIAELVEAIESEAWEIVYEQVWDEVATHIWDSTGLDMNESHRLLDILTGGAIPEDAPPWREVREWMAYVERDYDA